jgi:hypothetical protein
MIVVGPPRCRRWHRPTRTLSVLQAAVPHKKTPRHICLEKASGRADIWRGDVQGGKQACTREKQSVVRRRREKVSSQTDFPSPLYFLPSPALFAASPQWSRRDLNPRPSACKADALPAELRPQGKNFQTPIGSGWATQRHPASYRKWAHEESNFGPRRYQRRALTN